ncbi:MULTISPECIES: GcrA family cell cycle regulator [Rhizobium]|uniref:GcrA family cell cycle regulator n=1 Tax=Rhizobium TaxID=379 RepID=UPI001C915188|nr:MULTISPECIES: GcrA family cell cycle regulator [Rhizobium]MBY3228562.1 GcrA cell cycle regulator [Rhizobium laguerreae]MBY5682667.1 GcrA cell cycle regulator [Rhizobium leguminosarum]
MTSFFWTDDKIASAEKLWADGISAREIAERIGSTKNTVINMAGRHRDRFPARQVARISLPEDATPAQRINHADRVIRVTFSGAEVTLPRVAFIDGVAI